MNNTFEVRVHFKKKFTITEDIYESIQEAVDELDQSSDTPNRIVINHMLLTVPQLKLWYLEINNNVPVELIIKSFHQNRLNEDTFNNIPDGIEFLRNQPIGQITSTVIEVSGLHVDIFGLKRWLKLIKERKE